MSNCIDNFMHNTSQESKFRNYYRYIEHSTTTSKTFKFILIHLRSKFKLSILSYEWLSVPRVENLKSIQDIKE